MTLPTVNIFPILPVSIKRNMSFAQTACDADAGSLAVEPSPKRIRIGLRSFKDVDLEKLSLKDNGMTRQGNAKLVLPLFEGKKLQCNLTPAGFLKTPFGFDTSCKYEKPAFLTGVAAGKCESLNLVLQLDTEEAEFLQGVNDFFQEKYAALDKKPQWHGLANSTEKYGVVSKVKVILDGENQTQLKIVGSDKKVCTGYGWTFLKERLDGHNFRGGRCKVHLSLSGLWCVSRKAGLTLTASHLVLVAPEKVEEWGDDEVFDDEALLAEL